MATGTSSLAEEDSLARQVVRLEQIVGYLLGRNEELRALLRELRKERCDADIDDDDTGSF